MLLGVSFASCNNDDSSKSTSSIVGQWKLVAKHYQGAEIKLDKCDLEHDRIYFFDNNEALEESAYTPTVGAPCSFQTWNYTYHLGEGILRLRLDHPGFKDNEEERYKVLELTRNTLVTEDFLYKVSTTYKRVK